MATTSVRPSACDVVSATTVRQIFMKLGVVFLYKTLSSEREFHDEDGSSDCRREYMHFCPVLSIFRDRSGRNSVQMISTKFCLVVKSFVKIGETKTIIHLRA